MRTLRAGPVATGLKVASSGASLGPSCGGEVQNRLAPGKECGQVDWKLGKRVTDMRRAAEGLSKRMSGSRVAMAKDAGSVPFLEQRQPPKSIEPPRANPLLSKKITVGATIDAWFGKCKEIREHNVVAVVSDEPKQVICTTCNSRHSYRAEPPARAKAALGIEPGTTSVERKRVEEDRKSQERQDARRLLQKELLEAENPRPFDPKGRYKAGEIIIHPEHGRGKIENVLRSSMLVRFLEGLRPLDLS